MRKAILLIIMILACSVADASIASQLLAINAAKAAIKASIEAQGVAVGDIPFYQYPNKVALISGTVVSYPPLAEATIAQQLAALATIKGNIKTEIEAQGVTVGDAPLSDYAAKIDTITPTPAEDEYVLDPDAGVASTTFTVDMYSIDATPTGDRIAVSQYAWSANNSLHVYDLQGDESYDEAITVVTPANNPGYKCAMSDDKTVIALAHLNQDSNQLAIYRWDGDSYELATVSGVQTTQYQYNITLSVSPNGSEVLLGKQEGTRLMRFVWSGTAYNATAITQPTGSNTVYPTYADGTTYIMAGVNDGNRFSWYLGTTLQSGILDLPGASSYAKPVFAKDASPQRFVIMGYNSVETYQYTTGNWDRISAFAPASTMVSGAVSDDGDYLVVSTGTGSSYAVNAYKWDGDSYEPYTIPTITSANPLYVDMTADGMQIFVTGKNYGLKVFKRPEPPPSAFTLLGAAITAYDVAIGGLTPTLPSDNDGTTITTIGVDAFKGKLLTAITFPTPNTITTILSGALANNNFNILAIPAGVTSIGVNGAGCSNQVGINGFRYLTLPASLLTLGAGAFQGNTLLTSCNIAMSGVTILPDALFSGCNGLSSITIHYGAEAGDPSGDNYGIISSIGASAFLDTAITSVVIPNSCTSIGDSAFATIPGISKVILPAGVTLAGESCFNDQMGTKGGLKALYDGNGKLAGTYEYSGGWSKTY